MLFKYASQIGSMFVFLLVLFGEKIHSQWINNIIYFKYRILWFSVLDENASASFFCAKVFLFFFLSVSLNMCLKNLQMQLQCNT